MSKFYEVSQIVKPSLVVCIQSKVLSHSDSLTPGNYSLYVGDEGEGYPFQMVDKSITQIVLVANAHDTIAYITVRLHL